MRKIICVRRPWVSGVFTLDTCTTAPLNYYSCNQYCCIQPVREYDREDFVPVKSLYTLCHMCNALRISVVRLGSGVSRKLGRSQILLGMTHFTLMLCLVSVRGKLSDRSLFSHRLSWVRSQKIGARCTLWSEASARTSRLSCTLLWDSINRAGRAQEPKNTNFKWTLYMLLPAKMARLNQQMECFCALCLQVVLPRFWSELCTDCNRLARRCMFTHE